MGLKSAQNSKFSYTKIPCTKWLRYISTKYFEVVYFWFGTILYKTKSKSKTKTKTKTKTKKPLFYMRLMALWKSAL